LMQDSIEFRYTVDAATVKEQVGVRADGRALVRRLFIAGGEAKPWWYVLEGVAPLRLEAAEDGSLLLPEIALTAPTPSQ